MWCEDVREKDSDRKIKQKKIVGECRRRERGGGGREQVCDRKIQQRKKSEIWRKDSLESCRR